jgi:flagellar biosynthetic protein FliP
MIRLFLRTFVAMMAMTGAAYAQQPRPFFLNEPDRRLGGKSWIIRTFGVLTVLSVAPAILIMVTSFPSASSSPSPSCAPAWGSARHRPIMILVSLALFMTFYIMAPTFDRAWTDGRQSADRQEQIDEGEAIRRIADPFRDFMMANTRDRDHQPVHRYRLTERGQTVEDRWRHRPSGA